MKSFKQFILEAGIKPSGVKTGKGFVKGWTLKNKIHTSTTNFDNYHIKQVVNKPSKFGLNDRKILKIISDVHPDAPEKWWKEHLEELQSGVADNSVYIEEYLKKKGYCMFVLDSGGVMRGHGSVQGWDEKSCRLGAKALDDKYLPFETKGFKLFEVKPIKGRPKYITSKHDWYNWLSGKKKAGKRTAIGSTMAQFREQFLRLREAVLSKRGHGRTSYFEIGHPKTRHIKGKWKSKHVTLYTMSHGEKMHKTPLSSNVNTHEHWGEANQQEKDEKLIVRGRIDHLNKRYSVAMHVPSTKKEPHPKVIQKAYDGVHKHMEKNHPDYEGHEFGHQFY